MKKTEFKLASEALQAREALNSSEAFKASDAFKASEGMAAVGPTYYMGPMATPTAGPMHILQYASTDPMRVTMQS